MPNYFPLVTLCSLFSGSVFAIHVPLRRNAAAHSTSVGFGNKSTTDGGGNFNFTNNFDSYYSATIFLNGQPYVVDLDTGSSDLWVDTSGVSLNTFTVTGVQGFIPYGDNSTAEGPILLGNVMFGDFVVEQQAFISAPGSNATHIGDNGLLGVGPPLLSVIATNLTHTTYNGNSLLDNIFSSYPNEPNFITFSLSRSETGTTDGGMFTIGEIPEQFSAINDTPPLEVQYPLRSSPNWLVGLDAVIAGGRQYSGNDATLGAKGTLALLDTGTTLASAPPYFVDAIYKSIPGARFDAEGPAGPGYNVSCDAKVDISIVLGNITFPINPIDATLPVDVSDDGTVICVGAFTYNPFTDVFILGDTFLRNVFALYDFGNWTTTGDSAPFVKLLSVTNATQASTEFEQSNKARLAAVLNVFANSTT